MPTGDGGMHIQNSPGQHPHQTQPMSSQTGARDGNVHAASGEPMLVTLNDGRQVEIRCLREGLVFSPGLPEGCSELVNGAASD